MRREAEGENSNVLLLHGTPWHGPTPVEWVVIQPEKDKDNGGNFLGIDYPKHVVELVSKAMLDTDTALLEMARGESGLVGLAKSKFNPGEYIEDRTWSALLRTETKIMVGLLYYPRSCCVGVLNGVSPIWNHLKDSFEADEFIDVSDRVSATIISGYNGVSSEAPRVLIPLSGQIIESSIVYAMDDLIDSGKSIAKLYQEIAMMRGHEVDYEIVRELSAIGHQPFSNFEPLFRRLVNHLHEENIVVSAAYYKNETFLMCMNEYIDQLTQRAEVDDWAIQQHNMLDGVLVYGQHDWLMGRGLDTGIHGNKITDRIRDFLEVNSLSLNEAGEEVLWYIEKSLIRVGSFVDGLIVLNNNDIDGLTDLLTDNILQYTMKYVRS